MKLLEFFVAEENSPRKVFRRRVRELRKARGWTQADLASRVTDLGFRGVDQSVITRLERGSRDPTIDYLLLFAEALGVSPLHLLEPHEGNVQIAPESFVNAGQLRGWMRGFNLPFEADKDFYFGIATHPDERAAWAIPGHALIADLFSKLTTARASGDPARVRRLLERMRKAIDLQLEALDLEQEGSD